MFLVRLLYASKASADFNFSQIDSILESAVKNNIKNEITGMLSINHKFFLQCLEGERSKVNQTFQKIAVDSRHTDVTILHYDSIDTREFSDWSMGFSSQKGAHQGINLKHSVSSIFNPFEMSGASCYALLLELSKAISSE